MFVLPVLVPSAIEAIQVANLEGYPFWESAQFFIQMYRSTPHSATNKFPGRKEKMTSRDNQETGTTYPICRRYRKGRTIRNPGRGGGV